MTDDSRPLGVFDSGIGGLTVLKEIVALLPGEHVIYLGDTARVPYGIRSAETVTRYAFECTEFLLQKGIKFLVVACNTVSAVSLPEILRRVTIPVIGVIDPGAKAAVGATQNKRVGVIGTEATIKSNAYVRAVKALDESIEVFSLPCPLFVPLAEEGWTEGPIAHLVAEEYLKHLRDKGTDTVVLGCTHYPLLKGVIGSVLEGVRLIDSAVATAEVVSQVLSEKGMRNSGKTEGTKRFYVTDTPKKFTDIGERFLKALITNIERVSLEGPH